MLLSRAITKFGGAMGFSVRLAPGVRIRASSRGLRTSIGPRAARVHIGAGRAGISTGAGQFGFYTSLNRGHARSRHGTAHSRVAGQQSTSAPQRAQRFATDEKIREAQRLERAWQELQNLHRQEFPAVSAPAAPPPPPINEADIRRRHTRQALAGLSLFHRAQRAVARQRARTLADAEINSQRARAAAEQASLQAELNARWNELCGNDAQVTLAVLAEAFEDNEAPAAPVSVDGDEATLVLLAPGAETVPERRASLTPAGNLTLRKVPKAERAAAYEQLVMGHLLATLREAFAVAPGLASARVVELRNTGPDAYGRPRLEAILAGTWTRYAFDGVRWDTADARTICTDTAAELLIHRGGQSREMQPLDLSAEPDIGQVIAAVDVDDLVTDQL